MLYYHFWFPFQVMDFINDAIVSMDAFVTAYESAAVFFSCPVEMRYLFKPCIVQFIYLKSQELLSSQRLVVVYHTGLGFSFFIHVMFLICQQ